jgi:VanZ family protein
MLKRIKNLLAHNAYFIAIFNTLLILILSLSKVSIESPIKINSLDKYLHFSAYFILTICWFFALRKYSKKIVITLTIILFGIMVEFLQDWLTSNRVKDIYDALANSIGVIIAAFLYKYIHQYISKQILY